MSYEGYIIFFAESNLLSLKNVQRGTYEFMAPELLLLSKENKYSFGVDLWSVGCMFGEMITGKRLFPGGNSVSDVLNHMLR